jgi:hypothetical protein
MVGPCRVFPPNNPWNQEVTDLPVDAELNVPYLRDQMSLDAPIHLDFGNAKDHYGIPVDHGRAAPVGAEFDADGWPNESDRPECPRGVSGDACYPVPLGARVEGGPDAAEDADRHVIFVDTRGAPDHCTLYELYNVRRRGRKLALKSASVWQLGSNARRREGWTSADAAGLPILPGLVRFDEVARGEIRHALRFTLSRTANAYIYPATHAAGLNTNRLPPMGLRLRLRKSFDESKLTGGALAIVRAMKRYGMILADNGSDWFVTGEEHDGWGNEEKFAALADPMKAVKGADFDIVKTGTPIWL